MKLWVLFLFCGTYSDGAKILGVFNHPGTSHTFLGQILLKNLVARGHEVVMISSFPLTEKIPNYRDIVLANNLEDFKRRNEKQKTKPQGIQDSINMTLQHTENTFTNVQVQELIHSKETFDVIIMDYFYNEATLMMGHIFKAPVIYMSSFGNMALLNDFSGNVLPYSYVPGAGLLISDDLSFKHRVIMTLFNVVYSLLVPRKNKAHHAILTRHFENPPTIEELQQNVAVVLSNSHFSFETPRPYTPNIIPVGGFHVGEPQEMPQELQTFLDRAKEGVIYFSLGSQVDIAAFDKSVLYNIVTALGRVRQKVLWKYETENLPELPKNIKIMKWVRQIDVLAHPNVKLFITHGGMLSLIESIHYEVPLLCLPFNGDQVTNAAFIESRRIGLYIKPDNITENNFSEAMEEIITNPKYQREVSYRSSLLREQPVKPLDAAIYWTEHVIKYGHADHLKTFATKLPWYKYYLIDVIGFLGLVAFTLITLLYYIFKYGICKIYKILVRITKSKTE